MQASSFFSSILLFFAVLPAAADTDLPVIEDVEWPALRNHSRQLLRVLENAGSPLPAVTVRELTTLLQRRPHDPEAAAATVQKLLDAHCLIGVSINAESRVKAARGPAIVRLQQNRPSLVLLKIHNDGGVTHALRVYGPELRGAGRWLDAELVNDAPFAPELTGRRLEYRLLRLTPHQAGKREATFQFDVGQGTQDLGFRAEVPILFTVRKAD